MINLYKLGLNTSFLFLGSLLFTARLSPKSSFIINNIIIKIRIPFLYPFKFNFLVYI